MQPKALKPLIHSNATETLSAGRREVVNSTEDCEAGITGKLEWDGDAKKTSICGIRHQIKTEDGMMMDP